MKSNKENNYRYSNSVSIRLDDDMIDKLDNLENKLLLNRTSIFRLALAKLYYHEFKGD